MDGLVGNNQRTSLITRFAPSPTGPLHLGHAFSAITAFDMSRKADGTFCLRIEDIDRSRSLPKWERQIYDDLTWLGLDWPTPVIRQSERLAFYAAALEKLTRLGLTYYCDCSRRDVLEAASAPQEGARIGPDGVIYPGTCKHKQVEPAGAAIRLHMDRAIELTGPVHWQESPDRMERRDEDQLLRNVGDIVLARRDMGTTYHLSVVVDDADMEVTDVVRGADLRDATQIHVLLQRLLSLPTPVYHHHRLIRDGAGKRLAKRDDARAIQTYRSEGATPLDIRQMIGL